LVELSRTYNRWKKEKQLGTIKLVVTPSQDFTARYNLLMPFALYPGVNCSGVTTAD